MFSKLAAYLVLIPVIHLGVAVGAHTDCWAMQQFATYYTWQHYAINNNKTIWNVPASSFLSPGLGSLLYFSTSLQSKKVLGKSNEVLVKSTLLKNYWSKK